MVTADDIRACALALPRTTEHLIRDRVKFRVGKIVYVALSPDETVMGFGFPKEERDALIAAEPATFSLPRLSDQRFHWACAQLAGLDVAGMRGLVTEAWRMCVPRFLSAQVPPAGPAPGGTAAGGAR
jgi:hypothetical protein